MTQRDDIPLSEIYDYLNGHLDADRAAALEARAATDPNLARQLDENRAQLALLRRALPEAGHLPAAAPPRSRAWRPAIAAALVAFALGLGVDNLMRGAQSLSAQDGMDSLIELAAEAHSNSRLRLAMVSQVEHSAIDPAELTRATGIRIPALPEGWRLQDVQVYPSPFGPSIEIAVSTADNGLLSIYAVRVDETRTMTPIPRDSARLNSAVFQIDNTAYVLVGQTAPAPLDDEAGEIFRRLL